MPPVKLYTFLHSPNPLKVRLALLELGVRFEPVEINLFKGEHRGEAYRRVNAHGKVPVLEDGPLKLRESNAILAYLGRRAPSSLWPVELAAEARAMQWLFFESAHLQPHAGTVWWTDIVSPAIGRPGASEPVIADAVTELERSLNLLEQELAERAWLLGDAFSLADIAVGVALAMLVRTRLDRPDRWPRVSAYRDALRARPSWTEARGDAIHRFG